MTEPRYNDDIDHYTVVVADGQRDYCSGCDRERPLWGGVTVGGDELRCCGYCQRVISRKRAKPDNDPLKPQG